MNKKVKNFCSKIFNPIQNAYSEIYERNTLQEKKKNFKVLSIGAKILIGMFLLVVLAIALILGVLGFDLDILTFFGLFLDDSKKDNNKKIINNIPCSEISETEILKEEIQKPNKKSLTTSL
jgi:hypothetical protein